ncbi:hypothetical protein APR04_005686 [Promicromonospora umidemergens]|uniref:Uncharacterized protein n=3 Tax=Promicromonospora TaxID=43676 RepID=A0ABW4VBT0_9MICO|nr:hypothetical protein [Promicromonospora umidemergens]MCP2286746.1 hypothetical protein [Promicromonospora umidemergens]
MNVEMFDLGDGSDLALETADVIVVRDELSTISHLAHISRRARRYVIANLAIAATFIAVLVTRDLVATLPLPLAVAGQEGLSGHRRAQPSAPPALPGLNRLAVARRRLAQRPTTNPAERRSSAKLVTLPSSQSTASAWTEP